MTAAKGLSKKKVVRAKQPPETVILCNGARPPSRKSKTQKFRELRHEDGTGQERRDVVLELRRFVGEHVDHLPPRILDLLEVAAYVYAGDRRVSRGDRRDLEQERWGRRLCFCLPVRDHKFWSQADVSQSLADLLTFMSGDREISFRFQPGRATFPVSLFDQPGYEPPVTGVPQVMLFSGGLDSLAGAFDLLQTTDSPVVLVSHRSSDTSHTRGVQDGLVKELGRRFPGRVSHYPYRCGLRMISAAEETQRTRGFLYMSVALAVATALGQSKIHAHENGVTAVNFSHRADMENARMSRTVHPRAVAELQAFFRRLTEDASFAIETPFLWKTKSDVVRLLAEHGGKGLYRSSFSCGAGRSGKSLHQHCGTCSQCLDRRFAAFASGLGDIDDGGYVVDVLVEEGDEGRGGLLDFLRDAKVFRDQNIEEFAYGERTLDLLDLVKYVGEKREDAAVGRLHDLHQRHGRQVEVALRAMTTRDDPLSQRPSGLLHRVVHERQYAVRPRFHYADLARQLRSLKPGNDTAAAYEDLIEQALSAVFEPHLDSPHPQLQLDGGLRRVDITFTNRRTGFFSIVESQYPKSPFVLFECKNYSGEIGSPEYNQLGSTLGDNAKPQVGFLVCRKCDRKKALGESRRLSGRGLLMVLDDADLLAMLEMKGRGDDRGIILRLEEQFRKILLDSPN